MGETQTDISTKLLLDAQATQEALQWLPDKSGLSPVQQIQLSSRLQQAYGIYDRLATCMLECGHGENDQTDQGLNE